MFQFATEERSIENRKDGLKTTPLLNALQQTGSSLAYLRVLVAGEHHVSPGGLQANTADNVWEICSPQWD